MFSRQFYEKWISGRERNIKLLLEAVTYTCLQWKQPPPYNYNRNSLHNALTCMIAAEIPTCIISIKSVAPTYLLHKLSPA